MLRSVSIPLLASALALSVATPAPAEEAPPIGDVGVVIAGIALGAFTYPLEAGKRLTIQRHVLDPGEVITWHGPSTVIAMHGNVDGDLTNFPSCTAQQVWRAYPAYYVARSKKAGTLTGVTANTSSVQIEFYTVRSEAIGAPQTDGQLHREPTSPQAGDIISGEESNPGEVGNPVTPAKGCPAGAEGETTALASGVMSSSQRIDVTDHSQIVIYRHTLPAGYNSGWYFPYWPTQIIPVRGEITMQHSCTDATPQPVGQASVAKGPMLVKSSGGAEYLSVTWNIQNGFPIDLPFNLPELPPSGCPNTAVPR